MQAALRFLDHDGEMAEQIRALDWSNHPLGPPERWPQALRFAVDLALGSGFPTAIYWSTELRLLYNDAWVPIPADRHPWAIGRPAAEVWGEIWDVVGPQFERVMATGKGFAAYDQRLDMLRDGARRETYWNYSFSPIRDEQGQVVGVFNQGNETTRMVFAERHRMAENERLRELFEQVPAAIALLSGPDHVYRIANDLHRQLVGGRDVLNKPIAQAMPEFVEQGIVAQLDRVFASGEAFRGWAVPHDTVDADGTPRRVHADVVYQPIRDASGAVTDVFVHATDVSERVAAETARRESEERLELALAASQGVGTWDWDIVADRVTADTRFAVMYGVDPALAKAGAPLAEFFTAIHPDDIAHVQAGIAAAIADRSRFSEEYRLTQADGSLRWVAAEGRATYAADGTPLRLPGVTFDISVRKQAEEAARAVAEDLRRSNDTQSFLYALAERQRRLDTAQKIMRFTATALGRRMDLDRVGFYRVADERTLAFGPCWTSGALPAMRGTMAQEMLGAVAWDHYRAGRTLVVGDIRQDARYDGTALAEHSPAAIGVPLLRQGRWVASLFVNQAEPRAWTQDEVALLEAVAESTWDAVERVTAVAALRESEEKFRAIANSIDPMVWSTRPDGFHDYYNDRWYEFTGVPYGSTDGEAWNGMFHPDDRERAWALWAHCLATGELYHIEYRLRHHDDTYRWVLGRAQPVRDESGRIIRWFGTCTDIQEIVEARDVLARSRIELEHAVEERTRQLMAAEEQLRQAQKMEAVGQLTGGIAHDFNNMLAVVIGALDLLERRLRQGSTDVDRYVVAARDGATRAAALTQRLLTFARQTPLAPSLVDVNAMVAGMTELLQRTIGEHIRVETQLGPEIDAAMVDGSQLENVLLNLSVNSRDAMPSGGTLVIATAAETIGGEAAQRMGVDPGRYVRIAVSDTGSGMSPEVASRAFEPFFTTKQVGKGTGLGLSQVFGFIRQSGGHVRLDSVPGAGTTVSLYLPSSEGWVSPTAEGARVRDLPQGRADEVVLVVEDEERVRNFSVEALRELGYTVVHAESGAEALALIDAGQGVALLFTDVVMPEMTGRELADRAAERIPGLRVLFTSGYTRDLVGADPLMTQGGLLPKPFDLAQLAHRVRAALDEPGARP